MSLKSCHAQRVSWQRCQCAIGSVYSIMIHVAICTSLRASSIYSIVFVRIVYSVLLTGELLHEISVPYAKSVTVNI